MRSGTESDRGSAVLDFVLVTPLLVAVLLSVAQLGAWATRRAAAQDAAFAGARAGARTPGNAQQRADIAERATRAALQGAAARARVDRLGGVDVVRVDVDVPLRLLAWPVSVGPASSHMAVEPR